MVINRTSNHLICKLLILFRTIVFNILIFLLFNYYNPDDGHSSSSKSRYLFYTTQMNICWFHLFTFCVPFKILGTQIILFEILYKVYVCLYMYLKQRFSTGSKCIPRSHGPQWNLMDPPRAHKNFEGVLKRKILLRGPPYELSLRLMNAWGPHTQN